MSPPTRNPPRLLHVRHAHPLTPQLRRIVLGGDALAGFPEDSDGAHIKLLLPRDGQREPVLPTLSADGLHWPPDDIRPIARTYTVGRYDACAGELEVDIVLHGDDGPASRWAARAVPGDAVGIGGPGGPCLFRPEADWFLLAGDLSSVPLIAAVLRRLPAHACGHALIEAPARDEIQALPHPRGIELQWLVRGETRAGESRLLLDAVQRLAWPAGVPSVTLAGENAQVVAIRQHLLDARRVPRRMMYAVPYWKDRHTEEAYHEERHRIMDEMDEADEAAHA